MGTDRINLGALMDPVFNIESHETDYQPVADTCCVFGGAGLTLPIAAWKPMDDQTPSPILITNVFQPNVGCKIIRH